MQYLRGLFWIAVVIAIVWLIWWHPLWWLAITIVSLLVIALDLRPSRKEIRESAPAPTSRYKHFASKLEGKYAACCRRLRRILWS